MASRLPVLFISHGSPALAIDKSDPLHDWLRTFGASLPRPKAIVCISAHYETSRAFGISSGTHPETMYDFGGFPDELYSVQYKAPGDVTLAHRIRDLLSAASLPVQEDPQRPFDHGCWVPLSLMFPAADVPVVQVSLLRDLNPEKHLAMGAALSVLRDEGVLIVASGSSTHNLREMSSSNSASKSCSDFEQWLRQTLEERNGDDRERRLCAFKTDPAVAWQRVHPREEHFVPLFVALGAAGRTSVARRLSLFQVYSLSLSAYRFD